MRARVEFVDASDLSSNGYDAALASTSTAISCLAASPGSRDASNDFWAIDRDANIRFGHQAVIAGVRHLILVATFEGKESRGVSAFSAAKEQAVDALQQECQAANVTFTVIRPNAYFKDLTDRAFDRIREKSEHRVIGKGDHRINPIAREDVADVIVDCLVKRQGGDVFLGGPDTFSFREIGVLAARIMGKERELKIFQVSLWKLRLDSLFCCVLGLVSRSFRRHAALLNWMLYASTHDAIAPCAGHRRLHDYYTKKWQAIYSPA